MVSYLQITDEERRAFHALLRELRKAKEFTQESFAKALDVPQSFVSKIESGNRRVDLLEFRRICAVLGITFDEFLALLDQRVASERSS